MLGKFQLIKMCVSFNCSLEIIPNVKFLAEMYPCREMYTIEIVSVVNNVADSRCGFLHSALSVHKLLEYSICIVPVIPGEGK